MGLSQADLAKQFTVSKSTIAMYETNKRHPDFEMLVKLADFFNCPVDYLIGRSEDIETSSEFTAKKTLFKDEKGYYGLTEEQLVKILQMRLADFLPASKIPLIEFVEPETSPIDKINIIRYKDVPATTGADFAFKIRENLQSLGIFAGDILLCKKVTGHWNEELEFLFEKLVIARYNDKIACGYLLGIPQHKKAEYHSSKQQRGTYHPSSRRIDEYRYFLVIPKQIPPGENPYLEIKAKNILGYVLQAEKNIPNYQRYRKLYTSLKFYPEIDRKLINRLSEETKIPVNQVETAILILKAMQTSEKKNKF